MSGKQYRRLRLLKWIGLTACLVLPVALLVIHPTKITFKKTEIWYHNSVIFFYQPVGPGIDADVWHNWKINIANNPGSLPKYRSITLRTGTLKYISLPLHPFFFLMVMVTAVLWWLVPRYPSGCCHQCGYNLTGNLSGVCPECGSPIVLKPGRTGH